MMKLTFCGGAKTVTGANYLLEVGPDKVLVDCGLFQGSSELEFLNSDAFTYSPKTISHVFVTHSHQDHCGRIPLLVNEGFKGKIIATNPAIEMMILSLLDSAKISLRESRVSGFPPLYTEADVLKSQKFMKGVNYGDVLKITPRISVEVLNAGHILGSAMYRFTLKEGNKKKVISFTGDLGNHPAPLLPKHSPIPSTDILVMESAYGNRNHESPVERKEMLKKTILDCVIAKGTLLIPSFAIERTQVLLFEINEMVEKKEIPRLPIYIDSPLATKMTKVYRKYLKNKTYFNTTVQGHTQKGDDIFDFPGLQFCETTESSKALNTKKGPKIIIAGSGMSTAGRIQFHEQLYLPNANNFILFVGYQVNGTLGRQIFDGMPTVNIFNKPVKVRAHIRHIGGYSGHADQRQLINFVEEIAKPPRDIYLVQGEQLAAHTLKDKIEKTTGIPTHVPRFEESIEL